MLRDKAGLADTISAENGKSLADATAEVVYAAEFFRWFSEEAVRTEGEFGEAPAGDVRAIVHHRPVGGGRTGDTVELPGRAGDRGVA